MSPIHDLAELVKLATPGHNNWFAKTKALEHVIRFRNCSLDEAKTYICAELQKLGIQNFSSSIYFDDLPYDVYGKRIDGIPWYIKFSITEDEDGERYIRNISFHPTVKVLKTRCEELEIYVEAERD